MDKELNKLRLDAILKHIDSVNDDLKDLSLEEFKKSDLHIRGTINQTGKGFWNRISKYSMERSN